MYRVIVFPSPSSAHLSQAFAGLYDLRATGRVDLHVNLGRVPWGGGGVRNVLCIEATDVRGNEPRRIAFDVRDGPEIDIPLLADVHAYFKRTCDRGVIATLPDSLRRKVQPYGLNYACMSDERSRTVAYARQLYTIERADYAHNGGSLRALRRSLALPLRWLGVRRRAATADAPIPYAHFEADADSTASSAVLFMTRLWNPNDTPRSDASTLKQLNRTRIELVRTLRDRFGSRFIGGMHRDRFSEAQCPDCINDDGPTKSSYLQLMKSHLVGVASGGLHGSIGWKVAEYVAASRCIVSEPLGSELPARFVEGEHYLAYRTPAECADACERILDDPTLAAAMRRNNKDYYLRHLKPPALMLNHLRTATACSYAAVSSATSRAELCSPQA